MNRTHGFGILIIGFLCVVGLIGCDQRPAVPTIAPEPTQPVVVIVVTATSQPTLAPTKTTEPTITPIPTLTPIATRAVTATVTTTAVAQSTRPPSTTAAVQPTAEQPTASIPPATIAPSSFPAPVLTAPQGKDFREGDTLKYEFTSVGPLAPDQCYRLDLTLGNPTGPGGVGDWWVVLCGDQSAAGTPLVFDLKPGRFRDEPNYGSLLISADDPANIPPTPRYTMRAFMSVVRVIDSTSDPIHPTVEALSPNSAALESAFIK